MGPNVYPPWGSVWVWDKHATNEPMVVTRTRYGFIWKGLITGVEKGGITGRGWTERSSVKAIMDGGGRRLTKLEIADAKVRGV